MRRIRARRTRFSRVILPCDIVCFPNCEIKLKMKEMNWEERKSELNWLDCSSWDRSFGSHYVDLSCKCTESCVVLPHIRGHWQDCCHFDVFHWWRWLKYKVMTSLQFCVNVMVRLTIVILKNVAVASSGEIMTSVIPMTSLLRREGEPRKFPSSDWKT